MVSRTIQTVGGSVRLICEWSIGEVPTYKPWWRCQAPGPAVRTSRHWCRTGTAPQHNRCGWKVVTTAMASAVLWMPLCCIQFRGDCGSAINVWVWMRSLHGSTGIVTLGKNLIGSASGWQSWRHVESDSLMDSQHLSHKSDAPQKICSVTRDNA